MIEKEKSPWGDENNRDKDGYIVYANRKREIPVRGRKRQGRLQCVTIGKIEKEKSPWGDENNNVDYQNENQDK